MPSRSPLPLLQAVVVIGGLMLTKSLCTAAGGGAGIGQPLPHQDVDLYLVACDATDPAQLWRLPPDADEKGGVQVQLTTADPVSKTAICLNCASDRCELYSSTRPNIRESHSETPEH